MGNKINKGLILDRIKAAYGLSGNSELARFLGVAPNTITNWYNRNSIDFDIVFPKCENIDFNWLLTGKGPMLKSDQKNDIGCTGEENARLIKELVDVSRQLGEQIKENEILREQIEKLKDKEQDKSPRHHPVYSGTDIAAESQERRK
ncbi:Bacteriophage CI repressor helix-turn-helix domain-containing protein [Porphyromonadaceae bacterium KH3CP3RA]|nr:Bacteriophage CI repressor helix-turn-helix domain-containing protein [Porphyromonadaceae bacterium KH3CP3RA]